MEKMKQSAPLGFLVLGLIFLVIGLVQQGFTLSFESGFLHSVLSSSYLAWPRIPCGRNLKGGITASRKKCIARTWLYDGNR